MSLPSVSGWQGDQLTVSVNAVFRDSVTGVVATMLFDPSVVRIMDVRPGAALNGFSVESNITNGRVRVALAGPRRVANASTFPLVNMTVRLIGAPGSSSLLDLASATLNEGDLTVGLTGGTVTIYREAQIMGSTLYYGARQALTGAVLQLRSTATSAIVATDTTDNAGAYAMRRIVPGQYRLAAARSGGVDTAIDVVDASFILRHLVGLGDLSAEQQLAADVSGNGRLGTNDAVLILRYLVGLETQFPAGAFWFFSPADVTYAPLMDAQVQNFVAFCRGDVDGDWGTPAVTGKLSVAAGPALELSEVPVGPSQGIAFSLSGTGLRDVVGGMAVLTYDASLLQVESVAVTGLATDCVVVANTERAGEVRLAFAGAQSLTGSGELVRLHCRGAAPAGTKTQVVVQSASLNGSAVASNVVAGYTFGRKQEDFGRDGQIDLSDFFIFVDHYGSTDSGFDLDGDGTVGLEDFFLLMDKLDRTSQAKANALAAQLLHLPMGTRLLASYPNPFNSATVVRFQTAQLGPVEVAVYAPNGQRLRTLLDERVGAGLHEVTWNGRDEGGREAGTGVYLVRLQAGTFMQTQKALLVR